MLDVPLGPLSTLMRPTLIRRLVLLLLVALPCELSAQRESQPATGRIVGRVIDAATGQGITDAGVQIVGTTFGTSSGVDGRFTLANVPAGTVTIQVRRIGFATEDSHRHCCSTAGKTLEQNISAHRRTVQLEAQVVTASSERGTVNEALDSSAPRSASSTR